jgi:hypothetical protein
MRWGPTVRLSAVSLVLAPAESDWRGDCWIANFFGTELRRADLKAERPKCSQRMPAYERHRVAVI